MSLFQPSLVPIKNSIVTHLLKVVFSLYFLVAVATTMTHMVAEYYDAKNQIIQNLQLFQQTFEQGLSQSIYDFNQEQLALSVSGILNIPIIVGIEIWDPEEERLINGGSTTSGISKLERSNTLEGQTERIMDQTQDLLDREMVQLIEHRFPIIYTHEDGEIESLGMAVFYSSTSIVLQKVQYGFLFILVNAMIKTVALWVIFALVARKLLSDPLFKLISATEKLNFDNLEEVNINIKTKYRNELKILEEAFNKMLQKLGMARKALEEINVHLEKKVKERTYNLEQSNKKLESAYQQIQNQQNHLNQELEMANRTQKKLLPSTFPKIENANVAYYYEPIGKVGGDFYNLVPLGKNQYGFFVADVTGHGISAALLATLAMHIFETSLQKADSPAQILQFMNDQMLNRFEDDKFITMLFAVYDTKNLTLTYSGAAHPFGFILRKKTNQLFLLNQVERILGVFDDMQFVETQIALEVGDKILLCSDSIFEVTSSQEEMLGTEAIEAWLLQHSHLPIDELIQQLYELGLEHSQRNQLADDCTLLGIELHE